MLRPLALAALSLTLAAPAQALPGCDAFLDKPFTLAQLRATVRSLLGPSVRFA